MILCPNCKHQNLTGAAFCTECGSMLTSIAEQATVGNTGAVHISAASSRAVVGEAKLAPADSWAALHVLESGAILPLATRNEFTLGRVGEGQSLTPDIDLTPHQAYSHGVSRLHAVLKRGVNAIYITDLASANGTYLNGKRLEPHQEHELSHGDVLGLGSLKVQILLRST
jgi:hypothetical protein